MYKEFKRWFNYVLAYTAAGMVVCGSTGLAYQLYDYIGIYGAIIPVGIIGGTLSYIWNY